MGCSDEKWNEMVQDYARWQLWTIPIHYQRVSDEPK
jgi:hypothetical protein